MLMLHQHIIRGLLILFIGTLLLSGIVSYFTIKSNDMERYQASLESHIKIIQYQLPQVKDREAFAKVIKESTGIRFTLDFFHNPSNNPKTTIKINQRTDQIKA